MKFNKENKMEISDFIPKTTVQEVCKELGLQDWTTLTTPRIPLEEAKIVQNAVGAEALQISTEAFPLGFKVEFEHGTQFPDANVTNNHPLLTGMIVLAHLKEMLDYYLRLEAAEIEGDMLKALQSGDFEKMARKYRRLLDARSRLAEHEKVASELP